MILAYDSETTGFVNEREAPSHPSQPHLVQLACILLGEDGVELQSVNLIVRPDLGENGQPLWIIPPGAAAVHGITTDIAIKYGVPLRLAVATFTNLRAVATATAAHNINFDRVVLEAAIARCNGKPASAGPSTHYCTMRTGTDIARIPPTARMVASGRTGFKSPNLMELHTFLFGVGFEGAHDALADVRACTRCLLELMKRGAFAPKETAA